MTDFTSEIKIPYEASQDKRFAVSPDEFSRERVRTVNSIYRDLAQELPGVSVAFVLGGSLVKGKALTAEIAQHSDIDLHPYVDINEATMHGHEIVANNPKLAIIFQAALARQKERHPTTPEEELVLDAGYITVDKYIEQTLLNRLKQNAGQMGFSPETPDYKYTDQVKPIAMEGEKSILSALAKYEDATSTGISYDNDDWGGVQGATMKLAEYFFLDVGGGLKKYQRGFLQQLASMGKEEAEKKWGKVKTATEVFERKGKIPAKIESQFPQTFEQACKYYGVIPQFSA